MLSNFRRVRLAAVAAIPLAFLAGCGSDDDGASSDPATLAVTAADNRNQGGYGFDLPASVPAGPTRISLGNTGAEPHHAQLFKLSSGKTVNDLGAVLAAGDPAALLTVGTFEGGTGVVDPGSTSKADAVVNLSSGSYVFMCFISNAAGLPHVASGMLQPFTVSSESNGASAPATDGEVSLVDYAFVLPGDIEGSAALKLTNTSQMEPHEMALFKVEAGVTAAQIVAFFESSPPPSGPPPFQSMGGLQAILPGASQVLQLDLGAGRYIVTCFIPSVVDGRPHAEKGMIGEFTIR